MTLSTYLIKALIQFLSLFIPSSTQRKNFRSIQYNKLTKPIIQRRYLHTLKRLRKKAKYQKIKVAFIVGEPQKWNCQLLYNLLQQHPNFSPFVILSPVTQITNNSLSFLATLNDLETFFNDLNISYYKGYDEKNSRYIPINSFNADIVFFPQPWGLYKEAQGVLHISKQALTCYLPYCFHMFNSKTNYTPIFHALLWRYFIECNDYFDTYKKKFSAQNCITVGNIKLDNYLSVDCDINKSKSDKHRPFHIIYAPHHSFSGQYKMATFSENGRLILQLAKTYPNLKWTFKPHPRLKDELIINKIMSLDEVNSYYEEWDRVGSIHNSGNYYNLFSESDLMITDCISFLAEYLPSKKPLIYLDSNKHKEVDFSDLGKQITKHYYKVNNNADLLQVFELLAIEKKDPLKNSRISNISCLNIDYTISTSEKVLKHLEQELQI